MDTKQKVIAGGSAAALALGGVLYFATQQSGPAADLGHELYARNHRNSIYVHNVGQGWTRATNVFNVDGVGLSARYYNGGTVEPGGSTTGERCSGNTGFTVAQLLSNGGRQGCIMHGLGFADSYVFTNQDSDDMSYVAALNLQKNVCDYYAQVFNCDAPPQPTATPPGPTPSPTAPPVACECVTSAGIAQPPGCQLPIHQLPLCPGPEPTPSPTATPPAPTPSPTPACVKLTPSPAGCSLLDAILAKTPPATITVGQQRWDNAKACNDWRKKLDAQLAHNLGPVCAP